MVSMFRYEKNCRQKFVIRTELTSIVQCLTYSGARETDDAFIIGRAVVDTCQPLRGDTFGGPAAIVE